MLYPDWLKPILKYRLGNNLVENYVLALCIFILGIIILKLFKYKFVGRLKVLAARTKTELDDSLVTVIEGIHWHFCVLVALFIALNFITVNPFIIKVLSYLIGIILTYYAIRAGGVIIEFATQNLLKQKTENTHQAAVINVLSKTAKASLWLVAALLILSNLGYNVSALVAGLGIGGIAIALALQNVLSDIFCSLAIYLDKPFEIGDFIILGEHLGVVKKIGLRSTRIQALQGEEIVISNKELTSTRIQNFKKMQRRRIGFTFGIIYATPTAKLKKIPGIVTELFKSIDLTDLNRVHFKAFGDFSLVFEVVYYVETGDYNKYMDIQQAINLAIREAFEKEGIEMAFPTQTVYIKNNNPS